MRALIIEDEPVIALAVQADLKELAIEDVAFLLLDQARILEGETLPDPAAFARRMTAAMLHRVGAKSSGDRQ